jgi:hypothetical protein
MFKPTAAADEAAAADRIRGGGGGGSGEGSEEVAITSHRMSRRFATTMKNAHCKLCHFSAQKTTQLMGERLFARKILSKRPKRIPKIMILRREDDYHVISRTCLSTYRNGYEEWHQVLETQPSK